MAEPGPHIVDQAVQRQLNEVSISEVPGDDQTYEWGIDGHRYLKGQAPNAVKVAKLLENVNRDEKP